MNLSKISVCLVLAQLLVSSFCFAESDVKPKYGPATNSIAVPLSKDNSYFASSKNAGVDFYRLISFYVPQVNAYACSAAAVSAVINAAKAVEPKTSEDMVISQQMLLDKVKAEHWAERLSKPGFDGKHGTDLGTFGSVVRATFAEYGFKKVETRVLHVNGDAKSIAEVEKILIANEKSGDDYVMANFNQQVYTDDADAGHIAPVGAYDAKRKRVLILDPDREYFEPYWVSLENFVKGMATIDKGASKPRGLVYVKVLK